jgi:hypothetical protein
MKDIFSGVENLAESLRRITPQWLAGFVDGEGSITAGLNSHGQGRIRLIIAQHDAELLFVIMTIFPGANGPHLGPSKRCYTIEYCGKAVIPVLESIKPFLVLKRRQAEIALEFAKTIVDFHRKGNSERVLTEEVNTQRARMIEELQKLNSENSVQN